MKINFTSCIIQWNPTMVKTSKTRASTAEHSHEILKKISDIYSKVIL